MPTDHFIIRRDKQDLIYMPAAPECLSINISSMQTAKEHFHPWNTTAAGESVPRRDIQAGLTALPNPEHSLFFFWVQEKVGSEGPDPPVQPPEHPCSSVLLESNASPASGTGTPRDLYRHFGAIQWFTTRQLIRKNIPANTMGRKMGFCVYVCVQ